jgi:hypothetical protein
MIRGDMARYLTWAHEMGLLVSPGADFHGPSTPRLNHPTVPMPKVLAEQLLKALEGPNQAALASLARSSAAPVVKAIGSLLVPASAL